MPSEIIAPVAAMGAFFLTFMAAMAYGVISSNLADRKAVSYTHLTLPTSDLV